MLKKTGWLKEWSYLYLINNQIWEAWKAALQKLKDDAEAKLIQCEIYF
jgi:hypothetical protein